MRIVLVGGSGYLGSKLAASLVASGHEVSNLSRTGRGTFTVPGFTYGHMQRLFDGADAVVNLAGANIGEKRWTYERKLELIASRVDVTKQVVEAMSACAEIPALISLSGAAFYGNTLVPSNEAMAHGNSFLGELCYEWENAALSLRGKTRVAVARLGVVLDPNESALNKLMLPMKLFIGGPLGRGNQYLPWIHPVDAIAALRWMIERPEAFGPYNVVAPGAVTWKEFSCTLGRVMHRPSCLRIPELPLRMLMGQRADVVVDGQRLVPMRLLNDSFMFSYPTLHGALKNLLGK